MTKTDTNPGPEVFELTPQVETLPTVNPMQMLGAAIDRGMSVADLGPLMDLVERHEANQSRSAFMKAMADFQAVCPTIKKTGEEAKGRYKWPELDEVMRTIRPHLEECGLSIRFDTELTGESVLTATCFIMHSGGHTQSNKFAAPIDRAKSNAGNFLMNSTQQVGSARSYAKRYALMDALNLVGSEVDDDGAGAGTVEPLLTDTQVATLREHTEALGGNESKFAESLGADCLENVAASRWPEAMKTIERHQERKANK
jgi:hypothetical protein